MRLKRLAVVLGAVLALGGSVVAAPPSSACLVPCNLNVKSAGTLLGGGLPGDAFSFQVDATYKGTQGLKAVTLHFYTYVGSDSSYTYAALGNQGYTAKVSYQVIPGIAGAPSIGLVTIDRGPGAYTMQGHLTGQIGGKQSVGHLEVFGP